MAKKQKTRFVATISGQRRSILSIEETSDGGLSIYARTAVSWENEDGTLSEFESQHYSVHPSNDDRDTTITQKTFLKDGDKYSIVTFIPNTSDHLLWPVYAKRHAAFTTDLGLVKNNSKEILIDLTPYNFKTATLLYTLFVCRPSFDSGMLEGSGANFKIIKFNKFALIIIWCFLNVPSMMSGDVTSISSASVVKNDNRGPDHRQLPVKALPSEKIGEWHNYFMLELRDKFIRRLIAFHEPGEFIPVLPFQLKFADTPFFGEVDPSTLSS